MTAKSDIVVLAFPNLPEEADYLAGRLKKPDALVLVPPGRCYELYLRIPQSPSVFCATYLRCLAGVVKTDFSRRAVAALLRHPWTLLKKTAVLSMIENLDVAWGLENWQNAVGRYADFIGQTDPQRAAACQIWLASLKDVSALQHAGNWVEFGKVLDELLSRWDVIPAAALPFWQAFRDEKGLSQDSQPFSAQQALGVLASRVTVASPPLWPVNQGRVGHWGAKSEVVSEVILAGMTCHNRESLALLRHWLGEKVPITVTYPCREGKTHNTVSLAVSVVAQERSVTYGDTPAKSQRQMVFEGHTPMPQLSPVLGEIQYDRGQRQGYSATQLERYSDCPRRYFFRDVLGLKAASGGSDRVSGALWGTVVHRILELFFSARPFVASEAALTDHTRSVLGEQNTFDWVLARERLVGEGQMIRRWWTLFHKEDDGFRPWQTEVSVVVALGSVKVVGKVDAVWRHSDTAELAVVDYKTGKSLPERREIDRLERAQLPLYCLGVAQKWPEGAVVGAMYIHLPILGEPIRKVVLATPEGKGRLGAGRVRPLEWNAAFQEKLVAHMTSVSQRIRAGDFAELPLSNRCRACEFKMSCRYPHRWEDR